jgi:hypothetical protein
VPLSDFTSSNSMYGVGSSSNPFAVPLYGMGGRRRLSQAGFAELRPASNTSLCLDTPNNNFAGGQQLALEVCDGSYTQDYVMPIPGVDWRVRVGGLMECLETENNGTTAGTKVVVSGWSTGLLRVDHSAAKHEVAARCSPSQPPTQTDQAAAATGIQEVSPACRPKGLRSPLLPAAACHRLRHVTETKPQHIISLQTQPAKRLLDLECQLRHAVCRQHMSVKGARVCVPT